MPLKRLLLVTGQADRHDRDLVLAARGPRRYACDGAPADCVVAAMTLLFGSTAEGNEFDFIYPTPQNREQDVTDENRRNQAREIIGQRSATAPDRA